MSTSSFSGWRVCTAHDKSEGLGLLCHAVIAGVGALAEEFG
jgi:hypothetical protein